MAAMTHVFERVFLTCPYVHARRHLRQVLGTFAREGTVQSLALDKAVLVRFEPGSEPTHFEDVWNVFWTAGGEGPHPDFSGAISVQAGEALGGSVLELHGDYTPRLGSAGQTFDLVLGARIAGATARALLAGIAQQLDASN